MKRATKAVGQGLLLLLVALSAPAGCSEMASNQREWADRYQETRDDPRYAGDIPHDPSDLVPFLYRDGR